MGVVSATITSNGKLMESAYELLYLHVTHEFNRIPAAEIGLRDGDLAQQQYPLSDSDFFEPGRKIEIRLRHEDEAEKTVFTGLVVKQSLQANARGVVLQVELSHEALKMTGNRKSALFENIKDSDLIKKLIAANGIKAGPIAATGVEHKKLVQYYATDWDFLLSRAEVNGLLLSLQADTIAAIAPEPGGPARKVFTFGLDPVFDVELEWDARHQVPEVESRSWDVKQQQLTQAARGKELSLKQGNLQPNKVAKAISQGPAKLLAAVSLEEGEAQAWANAKVIRSRLSMIKGRFSLAGTAEVQVGDTIELQGIGKRFSGITLVTGVQHQVNKDGWQTDLQFGLSAEWFSAAPNIIDSPAAGLLPGVNGLQVGIVDRYAEDPEKEFRIPVKVPAFQEDQAGFVWCRLTSLYAGNKRGLFYLPEPGDEVILGFLNDDPRQAIILGAVHSSANPPPLKGADKNPEKGIVTRAGLQVLFQEEDKMLRISTSDKNMITLQEKEKYIEIKDANNNSIKISADGITLDSGKDVVIKSKGNVTIEASAKVEIKGAKIEVT